MKKILCLVSFFASLLALIPVSTVIPTVIGQEVPVTGLLVPSMRSFDRITTEMMTKWHVPGAAVAVAKDGRLVFAHGYGYADIDLKQPVQPDSLFRIGSISKPITATAILRLLEEGRLDLDAKAFSMLNHLVSSIETTVDPRVYNITIRQLLLHSAGWDRSRSPDAVTLGRTAAQAMGVPPPANAETVIRYALKKPLDFDPGTRYAYSNLGYSVLGRIIEKVTGERYEQWVKANVLAPMGVARMQVGRTLLSDRAEGEVRYYDYPEAPLIQSVFPNQPGKVPRPYGEFNVEALDSYGGWIASAIDLVKFAVSVDGQRPPAFLRDQTVQLMLSRPGPPLWVDSSYYYGLGWNVRPITSEASNWWHFGGITGSNSVLVRTYNDYAWAAVFNSRPQQEAEWLQEVDRRLWEVAREVASWPTHDLFGPSVTTPTLTHTTTMSPSHTTATSSQNAVVPVVGTDIVLPLAGALTLATAIALAFQFRKRRRHAR